MIASRIDCRPDATPSFALDVVLAARLETDEANEPASGFRESFSS
jgi:hypothetical protein